MTEINTQVAVMGSGIAGLSAGVKLARAGIKVAVFEKRPFQGGGVSNTPMMTLVVRPDEAFQDKAFKVHMEYTNYNANAAVVRNWLKHSSEIPDFVRSIGCDFKFTLPQELEDLGVKPGYSAGFPRGMNLGDYYFFTAQGKGHGGAQYCKKMRDVLTGLGGEFYPSMPINDFILDGGGKIIGALAKDKDGNDIKINCKALIVASGGYSDNPEMIKEATGLKYTDNTCRDGGNVLFNTFPGSRMTGDGQKVVWKAGGAKGSMGINGHNLQPGPGVIGNTPWICFNQMRIMQEQPYLWVNNKGERFIDESISGNHMAMGTSISIQPDGCGYIVFDEDTVKHMEEEGLEYIYFIFPAEKLTDVRGQFEKAVNEAGNKHSFMADTLKELAALTGIDKDGLLSTVSKYNEYCAKGHDDEFAKDPKFLRPVRKGKFYALRVFCGGYQGMGGIKIDGKCRVLKPDFEPIPGLYAAGDCCAGEVWGNPPTGGIGVTTISFSQGFITAEESAEYVKTI